MALSSDLQTWLNDYKLASPEISGALIECEISTFLQLITITKPNLDVFTQKLKVVQRKKFMNALTETNKTLSATLSSTLTPESSPITISAIKSDDSEIQRQLDDVRAEILTKDREISDLKLRLAILESEKEAKIAVPGPSAKVPSLEALVTHGWLCSVCKAANPTTDAPGQSRRCLVCFTPSPVSVSDDTKAPKVVSGSSFKTDDVWTCVKCKTVNEAAARNCTTCTSPYRISPRYKDIKVSSAFDGLLRRKPEALEAKAAPKERFWTCFKCKMVNQPTNSRCIECLSPHRMPLGDRASDRSGKVARLGSADYVPAADKISAKPYMERMKRDSTAPRIDEWRCLFCKTSNGSVSARNCRNCSAPVYIGRSRGFRPPLADDSGFVPAAETLSAREFLKIKKRSSADDSGY